MLNEKVVAIPTLKEVSFKDSEGLHEFYKKHFIVFDPEENKTLDLTNWIL